MNGDPQLARRMRPRFLREHVVLTRGGSSGFGSIECDTCGGPVLSQRELADAIGVSLSSLANFLHRRPVRQDITDKIRDAVKAVHE